MLNTTHRRRPIGSIWELQGVVLCLHHRASRTAHRLGGAENRCARGPDRRDRVPSSPAHAAACLRLQPRVRVSRLLGSGAFLRLPDCRLVLRTFPVAMSVGTLRGPEGPSPLRQPFSGGVDPHSMSAPGRGRHVATTLRAAVQHGAGLPGSEPVPDFSALRARAARHVLFGTRDSVCRLIARSFTGPLRGSGGALGAFTASGLGAFLLRYEGFSSLSEAALRAVRPG